MFQKFGTDILLSRPSLHRRPEMKCLPAGSKFLIPLVSTIMFMFYLLVCEKMLGSWPWKGMTHDEYNVLQLIYIYIYLYVYIYIYIFYLHIQYRQDKSTKPATTGSTTGQMVPPTQDNGVGALEKLDEFHRMKLRRKGMQRGFSVCHSDR